MLRPNLEPISSHHPGRSRNKKSEKLHRLETMKVKHLIVKQNIYKHNWMI